MAPKIWDLLFESNRIINSQPRHYLNLCLIFLLPLSFLSLIFQLIFKHLQQQPPSNPSIITFLFIIFILISSIFSYGAVITITYSVFHAFFNRPVKLKEAIKSITTSFFPLLATNIIISTLYFFVSFFLTFLIGIVLFLIVYLGNIDLIRVLANPHLIAIVLMLVILPLFLYLEVNLILARVVVVVESRWGLEPLKRSWKLMKGMKWLGFSAMFLFVSLQMILAWISGYSWVLILVVSPIVAVLALYYIVVVTLLYIYCKEKHGEVEEVEFGKEKDEANLSLIPL